MNMKKIVSLILAVALCCSISVGLTVAYLTDRDSEVNVFTVGDVSIDLNEDFQQNSPLLPGVTVEKRPYVTNTGKNDAWVWTTVAVPGKLADVIEFGGEGAGWNWDAVAKQEVKIDGKTYTQYTILHTNALKPAEVTADLFTSVTLDSSVDVDPNGDWYTVSGGVAKPLDWNNANGNPMIYVSSYAIQTEGLTDQDGDTDVDVQDAYQLYQTQWGGSGDEYAAPPTQVSVSDSAELEAAVSGATGPVIINLEDGAYTTNLKIEGGRDVTIIGSKDAVLSGQIATTASNAGTLTIQGVTVKVDNSIADTTGISQTSKSAIAIWGDQTVICKNVTFDMSLADSTAITSWWDTGVGTTIIVKNCTFNCNGQRPIRATGNVTVENTTFNDPYRYAVQLTAKNSTATELDKAIINFNNNTIVNGENGKSFVYGLQLEGADYGCNDLVINGSGNTIENGGTESAMYYCECGKVAHDTIEWNTEVAAVHEK